MGVVKRKVNQLWYRMKLRKELGNLDNELLNITYEEIQRERIRRNKHNKVTVKL